MFYNAKPLVFDWEAGCGGVKLVITGLSDMGHACTSRYCCSRLHGHTGAYAGWSGSVYGWRVESRHVVNSVL
jgi:hypothetical protein